MVQAPDIKKARSAGGNAERAVALRGVSLLSFAPLTSRIVIAVWSAYCPEVRSVTDTRFAGFRSRSGAGRFPVAVLFLQPVQGERPTPAGSPGETARRDSKSVYTGYGFNTSFSRDTVLQGTGLSMRGKLPVPGVE